MKMTDEQIAKDQEDYAAAFGEDMAPAQGKSEDEEFGIQPEAAPAAPEAQAPAEDQAAAGEPAGETVAEEAGDKPAEEEGETRGAENLGDAPSDAAPAAEEPGLDIERERQRLRSWEGRLRAIEAELKAKADAVAAGKPEGSDVPGSNTEDQTASALEQVADKADGAGKDGLADAAEQVAEQVEAGELTPDQAMKQLAEDFGEDFVRLIEAVSRGVAKQVATEAADSKIGDIRGDLDEVINGMVDREARAHFKAISKAHPDFDEIGKSEGFAAFVEALPDSHRDEAKRVVATGDADEIIDLLDAYKASQQSKEEGADAPASDPVVDAQMEAAEGVRSSGMALPETPAPAADSYEDAWKSI